MADKIQFQTNIPVELALPFLEGKPLASQFGGNQHMFFTTDGRVFFVSETVGSIISEQLKKLGVQKGEPIEIIKAEVSNSNGRKAIQWLVNKVGFVPGEQSDGTPVVPLEKSIEQARAGKTGASVTAPAPAALEQQPVATAPLSNGNGNRKGTGKPPTAAPTAPLPDRPKTKLEDALKTVVAACHAAREYAKTIGYEGMPPFTSEDIRTMANTLMIQTNGGAR